MRMGDWKTILAMAMTALATANPAQADGAALYATHCVACHQPDAEGAPGLAPPLAGTMAKRAASPVGRAYFAQVLVSGMVGTITSRGMKFNGNMPSFAALPDDELAAVIGHVLATFNGVTEPPTREDFVAARAKALPPNEVSKLRERVRAQLGE